MQKALGSHHRGHGSIPNKGHVHVWEYLLHWKNHTLSISGSYIGHHEVALLFLHNSQSTYNILNTFKFLNSKVITIKEIFTTRVTNN